MADLPLIETLGVVIAVFFGAIITLLIYFDKGRRKDITDGFAQMNKRLDKVGQRIDRIDQRIDSLYLHLVPQPTPGVVRAVPEPPSAAPEPELRTGTD